MNAALLVLAAIASDPRQLDVLEYGGHKFAIYESPMAGYWDYGPGSPGAGRVKAPAFDFAGTHNWAGYEATWSIRDSKLYLSRIEAQRDGKPVANREIIPEKRSFPVHAVWYSGRIHLSVGDFNELTERFESVIIFHVEKGVIQKTSFEPSLKFNFGWNGLSSQDVKPGP